MENDTQKERKQRVGYSKQFKRIALIEYSKGKSPNEIFEYLSVKLVSKDKKYASKLIHKWRNEFYKNLSLYTFSSGFDNNLLTYELTSMTESKEADKTDKK